MHQKSLQTLLAGILDYAGQFPPAMLPLEQAIRNYAAYRQGPAKWMLGRYVVAAPLLTQLAPFAELFQDRPPFAFSVLGRGGKTSAEFLEALGGDVGSIAEFHGRHRELVRIDALEVKLPPDLAAGRGPLAALIGQAAQTLEPLGVAVMVHYEMALGPQWRPALAELLSVLEQLPRQAGLKIRTGGLDAAAFPSSEQVASVIALCRDHGIAWKATAGLHHPIRHVDRQLGIRVHGFINVFAAAVMAAAHGLDETVIWQILQDENASHFDFGDTSMRWGDLSVSIDEIARARRALALGFGSCSLDEPLADLRQLGCLT
jgi:hypothetical protein